MTKVSKTPQTEIFNEGTSPETPSFDVNQRFEFLSQLSEMVVKGDTPSLLVTGEGGLGKTYTVNEAVNRLMDGDDEKIKSEVKVIKGYSTPRGLYNTLYDNNGKIIIFDDCDSVLEKSTSLELLKGALDSYDERIITWSAQARGDDDYPRSFEFTGSVIFISNKKKEKVDQAVRTRCMVVDVSMTPEEKIERMRTVLKHVSPEIPLEVKEESLDLIDKHKDNIEDLNFRTLIKVSKIKNSFPENWEGLATYAMFG